jgi:molybdate transport system ATP-binding protein
MRRFLIGRALLFNPRLLILDEPFDGLDVSMRQYLADRITALVREGLQIILVTHREEEMLPVITHSLELGDGRVLRQGPLGTEPRREKRSLTEEDVDENDGSGTSADTTPVSVNNGPPLIRMVNASVSFEGRRILDNLSWNVYPEENWLVAGPNGAGKSTLLRLISADHLQAYASEIYLFGRRRGTGESIWEIKQCIGMVSSEFQVRYRKSISGFNVILSGFFDSVGLFRLASQAQRNQAGDWVARLQIERLAEKPFDRMSSGQRRMVLIARAVVKDPVLLILDEPCQGLDVRNRERVLAMVAHIGSATPTNLIFTTHHADERPPCMTHELQLSKEGPWAIRRLSERD